MRAPALLLAALLAMAGAALAADQQPRLTMQPISLVGSAAANGEGPGAEGRSRRGQRGWWLSAYSCRGMLAGRGRGPIQ